VPQRDQDQAQKNPQPGEDESKVVADGGEDGVGGIASGSLEIATAKMALGFHMADHGFDGGAAAQLALDGSEHTALLPGDEDAVWVRRVMAPVSFVDIGTLDLAAGEPLGVLDRGSQGVPIVRIAGQRLGVQYELAARGAGIGGDNRSLNAELIGRAGVAFADAFDLWGMEGIQLPAALALRGKLCWKKSSPVKYWKYGSCTHRSHTPPSDSP
jgi:hypothetical protein